MNREKRISVRFAAVGGEAVKADLRGIGDAGHLSLDRISASAAPAEAGLDNVGSAAVKARQMLEQMAAKAAATAAQMHQTAQATTALQAQINRATGVTSPTGLSAAEMLQQGQALDNLRAKFNPLFGIVRSYKGEVSAIKDAHLQGAISADEMAAAISRARQAALTSISAYKGQTQAIEQMSRASRGGTLRMQQMFYQVNDIGVSLAGGMNPFVVLAQQGTQIAQIYGFGGGGVSGIFKDLSGLISNLPTPIKAVGVGALFAAVAFRDLQNEINKTSDITVSYGDTAKAVFQVTGRYIWEFIKPAVDLIAPWFQAAWDLVVSGLRWAGNDLIKTVQLIVAEIRWAVDAIPAIFSAGFNRAAAWALEAVSRIAYGVDALLTSVASGFNGIFGTNITVGAGILKAGNDALEASNARNKAARDAAASRDAATAELQRRRGEIAASDPMGAFFDDISAQAQANARKRAEDEKKKGGGGAKAAKEERDAVAELIKKLQLELAVLRETDPVKKKMLEYAEQLTGATAAQRAQVLALVEALDRAESGWEAVGRKFGEYAQDSKRLGDDLGDALVSAAEGANDAWAEFTKTGKLNFRDMISSFAEDLARLTFQQHVTGPLMGWLGGLIGGTGSDKLGAALATAGLPVSGNYEGGGHTGYGARSGGLDGRGGMLAVVHPRERIIDETRGAGAGASGLRVIATHDPGILLQIIDERAAGHVQSGLETYDRQVLPAKIKTHLRDPRAIG